MFFFFEAAHSRQLSMKRYECIIDVALSKHSFHGFSNIDQTISILQRRLLVMMSSDLPNSALFQTQEVAACSVSSVELVTGMLRK